MAVAPAYTTQLPNGVAFHVDNDGKEVLMQGVVGASDTYVTGGWAITPSQFGLQTIYFVDCSPCLGHTLIYNNGTGNVQAYSSAGTELVNASGALQNGKFYMRIYGK